MATEIMKNKYWANGFFLTVAIMLWLSIISFGSSKYADEGDHARLIHRLVNGNYKMLSSITTIPGYHVVIATIASLTGGTSTGQMRLISLILSLLSIGAFYLVAGKLDAAADVPPKILQYVFFPISFLYFPLIYTDIFSLLLVLLAFYFALSRKYQWSSIFSLLALAVRQTNIIWVFFLWTYTYVAENGFSFSPKKIYAHMRKSPGYAVVVALFMIFIWLNKGVAVGDREMQQVGFYMGNIYFFLALVGILFLPATLFSIMKDWRVIFKKNVVFGAAIGMLLAVLFVVFRPVLHEYNFKPGFLRDIILLLAYHRFVWIYAGVIFLGCLTLALMKFRKMSFLIFPFAFASLIPSMLVEQRYFIIPLVFILLFRKELGTKIEYINALYFILLSSGLTYMVLKIGIFF